LAYYLSGSDHLDEESRAALVAEGYPVEDPRTMLVTVQDAQSPMCGEVQIVVSHAMPGPRFRRLLENFAAKILHDEVPSVLSDQYQAVGAQNELDVLAVWASAAGVGPDAVLAIQGYIAMRRKHHHGITQVEPRIPGPRLVQ
jgi:hypothetical protein